MFIGLAALIVTDVGGLAIPWLTKDALDTYLAGSERTVTLWKYPALIVLAAGVQVIFRYFWRTHLFGFSRHIEWDFRNAIVAHLQRLPLSYFTHTKTGDLMSRLTNDMVSFREMLGMGVMAVIDAAFTIATSLLLMVVIDPWLTLWSLLPLPSITILVLLIGNRIFDRYRDVQRHLSTLSTFVQENLAGVRVVQAYVQEENQQRHFDDLSREYRALNLDLVKRWGYVTPVMTVLSGLAATIVLWLGGRKVAMGTMSLGELVGFYGYLGMLTWPMLAIGYVINLYQRGSAALARLLEILDTPVAAGYQVPGTVQVSEVRGEIELRNLFFRYTPDAPLTLQGITLTIPAGTWCGVVGETGAGKTTLVSLLPRLYEPPPGTIFIDGIELCELPLQTLKQAIGFVSQDIFLFSETIRDNILFGNGGATSEDLETAADLAQLTSSIQEFTHQFDTLLGERGVRLSGGQKQRTALARAIIKNPPILILDDAFSSVDIETEERILEQLKGFMRGRTAILISHRISTVMEADQIVYLKDGRIVERGSHEELLALRGYYYRLYRRQLLTRELDALSDNGGARS
ncbi:MAG: ABC transporter ATP-binding protein [Candidatus Methylomirabilis oxygeniifera]|uniref:ABC transporter, ATPase subunit n=1 Tax=Methylomirabilis oxygeniifera TaxID=671143 RepID=D5MJI3_METO1|nr:MAG: ABC transporter ATP-binding protein [Candidatus Methylomirabilis oxyfera]CBE69568.1 ABC transporter, ATPase subunit [Candidatus Methylomirabilis oxyfera]